MNYTTFKQAKAWVAPGYGKCDDATTAEVVNSIRRHFYNWYQEVHLFLDAIGCFAVKRFCLDCNDCQSGYVGVTLPREFQTVEAAWWNDWPLRLKSDWWEFQHGMTAECDCRIKKTDVPGSFSTIADILGEPVHLLIAADNPADNGKRIVIRGIGGGGQPLSVEVELSIERVRTLDVFRSINHRGGIVKDPTAGRVTVMDCSGRVYGRYEPDETVPSYRRIKLNGLAEGCDVVNLRAARKYFPLVGDDDVAETDNQPAWDSMARYLREFRISDKTRDSITAEKNFLLTAKAMMMGDVAREMGGGTQAEVVIKTTKFGGRQLTRTGRRW